jgi:hypothetical protein
MLDYRRINNRPDSRSQKYIKPWFYRVEESPHPKSMPDRGKTLFIFPWECSKNAVLISDRNDTYQ